MPNKRRYSRIVSVIAAFSTLARKNAKQTVMVAISLFFALTCIAQDQPQNPPPTSEPTSESSSSSQQSAKSQSSTVTIPPETRVALVLTNPVSSKTIHRGDVIYAQTTAPVIVGDQVLIPAGTFTSKD